MPALLSRRSRARLMFIEGGRRPSAKPVSTWATAPTDPIRSGIVGMLGQPPRRGAAGHRRAAPLLP